MVKKFFGRKILLVVFSVLFVLPVINYASHQWNTYHWELTDSSSATLTIYNSMTGDWNRLDGRSYLEVAIEDWNVSNHLSLTLVSGDTGKGTRKRCNADSGTIRVCNAEYGQTGWLGIAGISVSGDHIVAGYSKMNDTYFSDPARNYNTEAWRQLVVCQEIGHDFGLGHQDENFDNANLNTCMDYTSNPESNQHPNSHDYEELAIETMYGHIHSPDNGGGGGNDGGGGCFPPNHPSCRGGNGINASDFDNPAEWGQLVRSNGRIAVYERDFGNGNRVITFVIWAH